MKPPHYCVFHNDIILPNKQNVIVGNHGNDVCVLFQDSRGPGSGVGGGHPAP